MDLGVSGRVALVTGASRGLGFAAAQALAADGAHLVIAARDARALEQAADTLRGHGGQVETVALDVAGVDAGEALVSRALGAFGRLDILVANAGGPPLGTALEVSDEQLLAALELNLLASVRLVRSAAAPMRRAGWGRMCLIASNAVKQPKPRLALSNTARTGLLAWAKTAASDLAGDGVTLNLACPGPHWTDRLKDGSFAGRAGAPADFGAAVAFLCSAQAGFVNGTTLTVDGGENAGLL